MNQNRIVIELDGGLVTAVYADDPNAVRVVVMDTDTEGADQDDPYLTTLPLQTPTEAFVREREVFDDDLVKIVYDHVDRDDEHAGS